MDKNIPLRVTAYAEDRVLKTLEGAYDSHMHARPCIQARRRTMWECVQDFYALGMKGFVVKDHNFPTAQPASVLNEVQEEITVRGGITVASSIGGVNPAAVEASFKLGGKVFWMASLESAWMFDRIQSPDFKNAKNYKNLGVNSNAVSYRTTVAADSEVLLDETKEIIALCKKYNCVYETSHSSPVETKACLQEANKQGLNKFVITHANTDITPYSISEQKELVEKGAVIMLVMAPYMGKPGEPCEDIAGLAENIREVGPKNIVLATDFGLNVWAPAAEGMRMMVSNLLSMGIGEEDIRIMIKDNPERLYFD